MKLRPLLARSLFSIALFAYFIAGKNASVYAATAGSYMNLTPTLIGLETKTQSYIGITPNTPGCPYGGVYFSSTYAGSDTDAKAALAVATAAKLSGKLLRIDLAVDSNGLCRGTSIYIQ